MPTNTTLYNCNINDTIIPEFYKDLESFSTVLNHWRETELDGALKPGVESFSETVLLIVDVLSCFAKNLESNFAIPSQLMSAYCDVAKVS